MNCDGTPSEPGSKAKTLDEVMLAAPTVKIATKRVTMAFMTFLLIR